MAETNKQTGPVDLFGNPRLTPRQVLQQQLSALLQSTAERTAGADPRTRGVSMMGAAAGGLLRNVLINKGVLPKPPEVERAERLEKARDATMRAAKEQGITPQGDPLAFADLAAKHFLEAGDEQAAMMAVQWRQMQEANLRAAALEQAKLDKTRAET